MSTPRILVVDDEADIRETISEILTDEGYEVLVAGDGAEARGLARSERLDLVFLDIWMPDVDGITLLDGEVFELEGPGDRPLRILGVGDPTFTANNDVDDEEIAVALEDQAAEVAELVAQEEPDVLAVHNLLQAAEVGGEVPLVLGGHNHRRSDREDEGTLLLTVGSTGSTGLGTFTVEDDESYEAQVLRFVDGRLIGLDYLTLRGVAGEFTIDRILYDPPVGVGDEEEDDGAEDDGAEDDGAEDDGAEDDEGGDDEGGDDEEGEGAEEGAASARRGLLLGPAVVRLAGG